MLVVRVDRHGPMSFAPPSSQFRTKNGRFGCSPISQRFKMADEDDMGWEFEKQDDDEKESGNVPHVEQPFEYIAVLDFEATCFEDRKRSEFQPEIIEFPVMLLNTRTGEVGSTFHQYVQPTINPELSEFCTELTGITQDMVSQADTIDIVYGKFLAFVAKNGLTEENTAILTHGDWDLKIMWKSQAAVCGLETIPLLKQWINIKHIFRDKLKIRVRGMMDTLEECNLPHEGRHHSGIDDVKNILRCTQYLISEGVVMDLTHEM